MTKKKVQDKYTFKPKKAEAKKHSSPPIDHKARSVNYMEYSGVRAGTIEALRDDYGIKVKVYNHKDGTPYYKHNGAVLNAAQVGELLVAARDAGKKIAMKEPRQDDGWEEYPEYPAGAGKGGI